VYSGKLTGSPREVSSQLYVRSQSLTLTCRDIGRIRIYVKTHVGVGVLYIPR
jgi:hypothetical protein